MNKIASFLIDNFLGFKFLQVNSIDQCIKIKALQLKIYTHRDSIFFEKGKVTKVFPKTDEGFDTVGQLISKKINKNFKNSSRND